MNTVTVRRLVTTDEAKTLIGTKVHAPATARLLPSPTTADPVVMILDADTEQPIGMITLLDRPTRARLRSAVLHIEMTAVARMSARFSGIARTFGWAPKRIMNGRESCRGASCKYDHPSEHAVLTELSQQLADQFAELLPEQHAADRALVDERINHDWLMEDRSLWTSGVINHSSTLPYHQDGANFHTWSAMPTLRYKMDGGQLHLPEYDIVFPCKDGEVAWFCGRELVHGVTPMGMKKDDAYRFSIVYYATKSMQNCRSHAEETVQAAARRTERERKMAEQVRARINAGPDEIEARAEDVDVVAVHGGVEPAAAT